MKPMQRGVAIVLAMAVVALAALTATAIVASLGTWSTRLALASDHAQAQALVAAGVDWARALLSDDMRTSNVDYLGEPWSLRLSPVAVDNGSLQGQIVDEQGKFNLNGIASNGTIDQAQLDRFRNLLSILRLPVSLADHLANWIAAPSAATRQDDQYYLGLKPPYLAAHRLLSDVDELAQVRGFDAGVRARLDPFATALPRGTAVNVNTASPEVIAAIVEGLDLAAARALVAQRDRFYFRNLSDFLDKLPPTATPPEGGIAVSTSYFQASVRVNVGRARASGTALLERESSGWSTIVWRKFL
ncbi:MAG: type II secretion system minor pseudopilin GspK [Burkholderiales bacterium]